jgi:hypothetical protein
MQNMPEPQSGRTRPKRQYPPLYEKAVPIAVGIIGLAMVVLLIIALSVLLGLFPGAR